eukprot:scaffold1895_cov135-Skeletonema_dohrnii-CCMP3373.AAC.1
MAALSILHDRSSLSSVFSIQQQLRKPLSPLFVEGMNLGSFANSSCSCFPNDVKYAGPSIGTPDIFSLIHNMNRRFLATRAATTTSQM